MSFDCKNFPKSFIFHHTSREHMNKMYTCVGVKLGLCTLATSCKELTHWKRPWYWDRLGAGGEGDDRGWDGWMASPTRWTWVWVNSGSWWWTGRPGVLQFMGHKESDTTERLNRTKLKLIKLFSSFSNLQGCADPPVTWLSKYYFTGVF